MRESTIGSVNINGANLGRKQVLELARVTTTPLELRCRNEVGFQLREKEMLGLFTQKKP